MNDYIVYAHTNKLNGKMYIGLTNQPDVRWVNDGKAYKPSVNQNQNRPFWNAIQKYGFDSFEHVILEENLTYEEACEREIYYIALYDTTNTGYNVALGGNGGRIYKEHPKGMLGKNHSEANKKRQSIFMTENNPFRGRSWSEKGLEHPKGMLGKSHSPETIEHLKTFSRGRHNGARKVIATLKDGQELRFDCLTDCYEYFGVTYTIAAKTIKRGSPYTLSKHATNTTQATKEFVGTSLRWLENTEITTEPKESVVS